MYFLSSYNIKHSLLPNSMTITLARDHQHLPPCASVHPRLAAGASVSWEVVRRFSDFESLLWALRPQGSPWADHELPPKRWFNKHEPSFLDERRVKLSQLLDTLLSNPSPPAPLRQFLEVSWTEVVWPLGIVDTKNNSPSRPAWHGRWMPMSILVELRHLLGMEMEASRTPW